MKQLLGRFQRTRLFRFSDEHKGGFTLFGVAVFAVAVLSWVPPNDLANILPEKPSISEKPAQIVGNFDRNDPLAEPGQVVINVDYESFSVCKDTWMTRVWVNEKGIRTKAIMKNAKYESMLPYERLMRELPVGKHDFWLVADASSIPEDAKWLQWFVDATDGTCGMGKPFFGLIGSIRLPDSTERHAWLQEGKHSAAEPDTMLAQRARSWPDVFTGVPELASYP